MEAKDTVIKMQLPTDRMGKLLLQQAEISFNAGYHQREVDPLDKEDRCEKCYEQGIKEVVDWIEKNKIEIPTLTNIEINYHEWQFKKNSWGIKED